MARSPGRTGHAWRKACAVVLGPDVLVCFRCGQLIDKTLAWPHTRSKSVDHLVALVEGGDPLDPGNLGPAHLGCNARHGALLRTARAQAQRTSSWVRDAAP